MSKHPEQFDRGSAGEPYDPDEALLVRWADVIAARNAVQALLAVLKDLDIDLEDTRLSVGWQVRNWLPTAIDQPHQTLDTLEDAVEWLEALSARLRGSLP